LNAEDAGVAKDSSASFAFSALKAFQFCRKAR